MRHRRWVVVLAVFVLAVLPLAFLSLEMASRNPAIKRAVLSRIIPEVAGELSIGRLEIGFGSLEFGDVTLELAGGGFVSVPSATVSLSLRRFLVSGLAAEEALSSIIVTDPLVAINYGMESGPGEETPPAFDVASLERYLPDYLGVSNATVVFTDVRTGRGLRVDSIDFLLERSDDAPAVGEALGSVLGGSGNLSSQFTWDSDSRTLSVSGKLTDTGLSDDLPVPPALPVEIISGTVSADFVASVSPDSVRGLDLSFRVSDAGMLIASVGEELSSVSAEGRFNDGVLTLRSVSGEWRSASWAADGAVRPAGGEIRAMSFRGSGVPLGPALVLMGLGEQGAEGRVDVTAGISGSFESPTLDVAVRGRQLSVRNLSVAEASAAARFGRGSVDLRSLQADVLGGRFSVSGTALRDPDTNLWSFDLTGDALDLRMAAVMAAAGGDTGATGSVSLT
ncbi:MAG: hypothetical protein JXB46_00475, partial [Candidatus Eisenbacteria bacterium]|nr:hypothetical protein [Candidatus Eisenbacteria bacterium]